MNSNRKGKLYLIPNLLGGAQYDLLSPMVRRAAQECTAFAVESLKMGRRLLHHLGPERDLDEVDFFLLKKDTDEFDLQEAITRLESGENLGLISDAGLPAVADPGSQLVALAHRRQIRVYPLSGPSSPMLALMASGLNGQQFRFHGYLPRPKKERERKIKDLCTTVNKMGESQIFIETPYRNQELFASIMSNGDNNIKLCVACDLTLENEWVRTLPIRDWKSKTRPELHKRPSVFILGQ